MWGAIYFCKLNYLTLKKGSKSVFQRLRCVISVCELLKSSLCREDKFYAFLPAFSFTIPFEKARDFRKKSGHYLRESQYNDLQVDVYL